MASSAYKATTTGSENPTWQCFFLYSQRCTGSHFLWLSGPHSKSAPSLTNQDAYPLMHRDEQSAWQAGSYSSLTLASKEWCNRTAPPSHFPSCFSFSQSPLLCIYPCSLLPSLLLSCTLIILFPLFSPLLSLLLFTVCFSFTLSISPLPRGPCFLACITHNYFHPSIICLLLFSYPTSLSLLYDNNPHYPAYAFLSDLYLLPSHPPGQLSVPSQYSCPLLPFSPPPKAYPSCCPLSHQMSLKFGRGFHVWRGREQ